MDIKLNYHSSVLINNLIWIDPLKVCGDVKVKYIFITHPHWDHFSVDDIKKIMTKNTKFVCPLSMKTDFEGNFKNNVLYVEPNNKYVFDGIEFETFSAYNINNQYHPKVNGWVGYTIVMDGQTITITGDTDYTAELEKLHTDILLVPIGGTYTMNIGEAVDLVNLINPKKVIPTHYGDVVGDKDMGKEFSKLINNKIICELLL